MRSAHYFRCRYSTSMIRITPLVRNLQLLLLLLLGAWKISPAQTPKVYTIMQHKLLWADTVYREAIKKNDSLLLAESYYLYGKTYEGALDLLTSQKWFFKSLAIIEPRGNSYNLVRLYGRIASIEIRMGHYAESRRYITKALSVARKLKDDRAILVVTGYAEGFFGIDWSRGGKFPELPVPNQDSVSYYGKLNDFYLKKISKKDKQAEMEMLMKQGYKQWYQKRDTTAINYFRKSLNIATQTKKAALPFRILNEMATIYLKMDMPKNAWWAIKEAETLLHNSPFKDAITDQIALERFFRDYYVKTGNWKKAYEHGERLNGMEHNNYISDREGAVTRLNIEYETEKKEARLKSQQLELSLNAKNLKTQRQFLLAMGALLILAIGAGGAFYWLYRKNRRISRRNAELVREQNHRVKNNLQVVSSLLSLQSNRLTDKQARQAVEESQLRVETMAILHRNLYDGEGLISIDMKEFIPQLVEGVLQTYGFHTVKTHYAIGSLELSAVQALPVGLIVNELITNACKYAFSKATHPEITISCFKDKNRIVLKVADNGPGIDESILSSKSTTNSFGLRLVRIQVEQLYGSFQFKNEGGTLFQMQFNVN